MIDKFREDEAKSRASILVSQIDAQGTNVVDEVYAAALVPLSPTAAQAVFNLGCMILTHLDAMAAILAGNCPEAWVETFATAAWPPAAPHKASARRPRRPRPTAAERRAAADLWLATKAWEIVDPDAPDALEGGDCP